MRSAKELMTTSVPMAQPDETVGVALERLREQKPEEASHLYLIDDASVLTGQVPIEGSSPPRRKRGLAICVAIRRSKSGLTTMLNWLPYWRSSATTGMWRWLTINEGYRRNPDWPAAKLHEEHVDEILRRAVWARASVAGRKRMKRSGRSGRECPGSRWDC